MVKEGCLEATSYFRSALVYGDIDERTPLERFQIAYDLLLSGDKSYELSICQSLKDGSKFGQETRCMKERFQDLEELARRGIYEAENIVTDALFSGSHCNEHLSEEERYQKLKLCSQSGAFQRVTCLVQGKLGQSVRPEADRFAELLELVPSCFHATHHAIEALLGGSFGQHERPFSERLKHVEDIVFAEQEEGGNIRLGCQAFTRAIENGELKECDNPFQYLEELARRGLKEAQQAVIRIVCPFYPSDCKVELTDSERLSKLESYILAGYPDAADAKCEAVYSGKLGMNLVQADERVKMLRTFAEQGIGEAKRHLGEVLDDEGFLEDRFSRVFRCPRRGKEVPKYPLSPGLLFSMKMEKAKQGDQKAKSWICQALYEGKDGQGLTFSERMEILRAKAIEGDEIAIPWVVKDLLSRQPTKIPGEDWSNYLAELEFWALKGNDDAQRALFYHRVENAEGVPVDSAMQDLMALGIRAAVAKYCDYLVFGFPEGTARCWTKESRLEEFFCRKSFFANGNAAIL
jgi:hypothetical protein